MAKEDLKITILPITRDYPDPEEETPKGVVRIVPPIKDNIEIKPLGYKRDYGEEGENESQEGE